MSDDETVRQTAPVFPSELVFNSSSFFFQKLPNGGMTLKFSPSAPGPQGNQLMPLPVAINFDARGWERFKRSVEMDGEVPNIVVPMNGSAIQH